MSFSHKTVTTPILRRITTMWIFTKEKGSFNTDHIKRIESMGTSTYVVIDAIPMCISRNPVEDVIREAIRRGDNYVEVE